MNAFPQRTRTATLTSLLAVALLALAVILLPGCGKGGDDSGADVSVSLVPNVVGMAESDAADALEDAGFEVGDVTYESSDDADAGEVLGQSPAASSKQEEGAEVDLVVSLGEEVPASSMVEVPSLAHMTPAQAEAALAKLGLKGRRGDDVEAAELCGAMVRVGHVGAQEPASGTNLTSGMTVTYHLAKAAEEVDVPSVTGKSKADATSALEAAGFVVNVTYDYSDSVSEGNVISQSPSGGKAGKGTTVTIVVSKGPKPEEKPETVTVPDVSYEYKDAAANLIQSLGLEFAIDYDYNDSVPNGCVIYTNPGPGTEVEVGSTVTIMVSYGPEPTTTVTVPNTVGTDETSALAMLTGDGFNVYTQYFYDEAPAGQVIDQEPPGWSEAEPGSYVTITISEGPAPEGAVYG